MKVIAHEHISMDPDLVNPNGGPQLIEKSRPILVIGKNIPPLIAAAGDVINRSRIIYPQWARHSGYFYPRTRPNANSKDLTPDSDPTLILRCERFSEIVGVDDGLRRYLGDSSGSVSGTESGRGLGKVGEAFSSSLWRVEALRTVDRLPLSGDLSDEDVADLVREIRVVHETLAIYPVVERILQRASESFPTVVGTFDATHLATALAIRQVEPIDILLTHDAQLATAARGLGFTVGGVS
jgi:hypothetical protein